MSELFPEEYLNNFTYSKKSHFNFFNSKGYDKELYGKVLDISEDTDLLSYQNLLVYSLLNNKSGLKILQIGLKNLTSFEKLDGKHECWKVGLESFSNLDMNFNFLPVTATSNLKITNPKSYFDFIFLSSMNDTIPSDNGVIKNILLNIKNLLKPKGIFLGSFMNIIVNNGLWFDEMFDYFLKEKKLLNEIKSYAKIHGDSDLYILTEKFYNKYWQKFTNKPFNDFGKAFCYNLFIENRGKIYPQNFSDFTYLKKTHKDFFNKNGYLTELFKENIKDDYDLPDYKSLLIYSFVKSNFKKGDKILQIGNATEFLEKSLSLDYEFYKLENPKFLEETINIDDKILKPADNQRLKLSSYNNFFNFTYSFNENFEFNPVKYFNVVNNIDRVMLVGGFTLFSFNYYVFDKKKRHSKFQYFLFTNNVFKLNKFIDVDNPSILNEIYIQKVKNKDNNKDFSNEESVYSILWQKVLYLPTTSKTKHFNRLKKYPIYLFHHLMKCGGTSMFFILDKWFKRIDDNILFEDLNTYILQKYNINIFHNDICLRAHFQRPGIYLHERYSELLNMQNECRVFTFIRNPLSIKISKYYYLKNLKFVSEKVKLTSSLMQDCNFISSLLPCDETNYKEIIDRYFFVGIVEKSQESFDILADLIGKKRANIPFLNTSEKDSQVEELTPEFIEKFKKLNALDYKIYDYCLEKYNKFL